MSFPLRAEWRVREALYSRSFPIKLYIGIIHYVWIWALSISQSPSLPLSHFPRPGWWWLKQTTELYCGMGGWFGGWVSDQWKLTTTTNRRGRRNGEFWWIDNHFTCYPHSHKWLCVFVVCECDIYALKTFWDGRQQYNADNSVLVYSFKGIKPMQMNYNDYFWF